MNEPNIYLLFYSTYSLVLNHNYNFIPTGDFIKKTTLLAIFVYRMIVDLNYKISAKYHDFTLQINKGFPVSVLSIVDNKCRNSLLSEGHGLIITHL